MRYTGVLISAALLALGSAVDAKPLEVKALIEIAEHHGLPMPPRGARLVLAHTESWSVLGRQSTSRDPGIYSPAYLLKEESDGSIHILRGAEQETLQARHSQEPLWRPFSTEDVEPKLGGHISSFNRFSAFVCAVQTAAIGEEESAQAIWSRFSAAEWLSDARFGESIAEQLSDQRQFLGRCIFDHLRNALLKAGVDRKGIHTRMSALLKEFPKLNADWRAQLFDDLTTTVNAAQPKAGSVESLLLDWAARPSTMRHLGIYSKCGPEDADAPAREILSRGRDAVPELIALLQDSRLTAHEQAGIMKAPARVKRVGELARDLVRQIAGDQPSFPKYGDDTDAIRVWWETARAQDESVSLLQSVFKRGGGKITGVNEGPARIMAKKFPEKLLDLCNEFARDATPEAQPSALAKAIAESDIPKERRVRALSAFAGHGSLEHKCCVLQNLAKLDDKACAVILLPILKQLPKDATGPYWTCPEARFTHVVVQLDDDEVWQTYLQSAKRSSVGLRMEMMNPMNYMYMGQRNLARRLAFLSAFLDDDAVRTMAGERGQFQGPCAGFTIPRLAVRDLAAMKLASLLAMKEAPDEFWTDAQWAELRRKVKERLVGSR